MSSTGDMLRTRHTRHTKDMKMGIRDTLRVKECFINRIEECLEQHGEHFEHLMQVLCHFYVKNHNPKINTRGISTICNFVT